ELRRSAALARAATHDVENRHDKDQEDQHEERVINHAPHIGRCSTVLHPLTGNGASRRRGTIPPDMGHPEFTFLLARQRTGTNALRSVLHSNPDLWCFDEVFKIEDRHSPDAAKRISNYFTFLEQYCAGDVTR